MAIVKYNGKRYMKIFDLTERDEKNPCNNCQFAVYENGEWSCGAPNEEEFHGCDPGNFHWELQEND